MFLEQLDSPGERFGIVTRVAPAQHRDRVAAGSGTGGGRYGGADSV
jgi:hypothetical protein